MVMHNSGPFFSLNEKEWKKAVKKYPNLDEDSGINYVEKPCTASLNVGHDCYFDNSTVLSQFERLFQMLEFKHEYKSHDIEVLVDNARTHTALEVNINDFR